MNRIPEQNKRALVLLIQPIYYRLNATKELKLLIKAITSIINVKKKKSKTMQTKKLVSFCSTYSYFVV